MKNDSEEYIKSRNFFDKNAEGKKEKMHPIVVCWKLKTPNNIGNILRLADNMACEKVLFVHDNPSFRDRRIKKTAQTSFDAVKWSFCSSKNWEEQIPKDYKIIAIETTNKAKNLFKTTLDEKTALILGNEKVGIDELVLEKCNSSIFIPMKGHNRSMNVSHALTIVIGEWMRQNYYL